MAKKSGNLLLDALSAVQKFIVGASEGPPLGSLAIRAKLDGLDLSKQEDEVDRLEASRRDILITGTDDELAAIEGDIAVANRSADRAKAYRDRLEEMLVAAEEREAADALARARAEAERLSRAAIESLKTRLPALYEDLRSVIRQVAEAEIAAEAINAKLPLAEHVLGPEAWRNAPGREPEWIMAEEVVSCWCFENGNRLDDRLAAKVVPGQGASGYLPNDSAAVRSSGQPVIRRPFRKVTKFPEIYGPYIRDLAAEITLPPIRVGERAGWDFDGAYGGAERVLAAIAEAEATKAAVTITRTPIVVYEAESPTHEAA